MLFSDDLCNTSRVVWTTSLMVWRLIKVRYIWIEMYHRICGTEVALYETLLCILLLTYVFGSQSKIRTTNEVALILYHNKLKAQKHFQTKLPEGSVLWTWWFDVRLCLIRCYVLHKNRLLVQRRTQNRNCLVKEG